MEISISQNPRIIQVNKTIGRSEFNAIVVGITDGDVVVVGKTEVSIKEFVKNGDFLFYCESQLTRFLCGNSAILEQIQKKISDRVAHDLQMAFDNYEIEVIEND